MSKFCFLFLFFSFFYFQGKIHLSEIGTENNSGIIELYNASDIDIDLKQQKIRIEVKKNTSSSQNPNIFCLLLESDGIVKSDFVIAAHGYFLIVSSNAISYTNRADFIVTNKTSNRGFFDGNDTVFLANGSVSSLEDSDILEFVGLGNNSYQGNSSAPAITGNETIEKKANLLSTANSLRTGKDTLYGNSFYSGNNGDDWVKQNQNNFQNKSSAIEIPNKNLNDFFIESLTTQKLGIKINHSYEKVTALAFKVTHTNQNAFLKKFLVSVKIKNSLQKNFIQNVELTNSLQQKISLNFISNDNDTKFYFYEKNNSAFALANTTNFLILNLNPIKDAGVQITSAIMPLWVIDNNNFSSKGLKVPGNDFFSVERILFSEIKTQGEHSEDEYMELYNSTTKDVSLENWSIHYQSSTGNWKRLFSFPKINITNQSYFLIGGRKYKNFPNADLIKTLKLSSSDRGFSLALKNKNDILVDRVSIGNSSALSQDKFNLVPNQNQSLERKAISSSTSQTMTNHHFYFGNGFDSLNSNRDFVLSVPNPQNSFSLAEPVGSPKILSVNSLINYYGAKIVMKGKNFLLFNQENSLSLGNQKIIDFDSWQNEEIIFKLPNEFIDNQKFKIKVKNIKNQFLENIFDSSIRVKNLVITESELRNVQPASSLKINLKGLQNLLVKESFTSLSHSYLQFKI